MAYLGSGAAPKATAIDNNVVETADIQDGAVTAGKMATGAAASNLGSYVSQVNGQSGSVTVEIPASFASGTLMLFQQTSAPTGWTKQTTHDNKALRVVSGTAGSGGSVAFTTAFASGLSAGATTLTTAQMPSHNHTMPVYTTQNEGGPMRIYGTVLANFVSDFSTSSQGSGSSHNHSLPSFAVQYVDLIIAAKN